MQLALLGVRGSTSINMVTAALSRASLQETTTALASTNLTQEEMKHILMLHGVAEAEAETTAAQISASRAYIEGAGAMNTASTSASRFGAAMKGAGTAAMGSGIFTYIAIIALVVSTVSQAYNKLKQNEEEARSRAIEAGKTASQLNDAPFLDGRSTLK